MKKFLSVMLSVTLVLLMCPAGIIGLADDAVRLIAAEFTAADTVRLTATTTHSLSAGELAVFASQDYGAFVPLASGWTVSGNMLTFGTALAEGTVLRIEGRNGVTGIVTASNGDGLFPSEITCGDDFVDYTGNVTHAGTVSYLNDAESSYEFVFVGSGFCLYGPVGATLGMADVYIDGILAGELDAYAAVAVNEALLYTCESLSFGLHRVTVMKNRKQNDSATGAMAVGFTRATIVTERDFAGDSLSLNGQWNILKGETTATAMADEFGYDFDTAEPILVPGNIWEAFPGYTGTVWYGKVFHDFLETGVNERAYLRFEAVQYTCDVYLNGVKLGSHTGSEIPFEFDVTDAIRPGSDNFLAVAVTNTTGMLKVGQSVGTAAFWDCGGIWQEVSLNVRPNAYISDVYAIPDWQTGDVDLQMTVVNATERDVEVSLGAVITDKADGTTAETVSDTVFTAAPGKNVFTLNGNIANFKLWDTENPNLYNVAATISSDLGEYAYKTFHFGFRHIEIKNGYYFLNGKRFFLKMTHQNVYDPLIIQGTPRDLSYQTKSVDQMKAAGFNVFRTIGMAGLPAQLDYADEQGMMVYEESSHSWTGKNSWVNEDYDALVIRDRNHPSIIIWGLLNEIGYSGDNRLDITREYISQLRKLDMTRLVIWTSGSWDSNSQIPHISNSGSDTWDVYLGGEDPNKPAGSAYSTTTGWTGDMHYYPTFPTSQNMLEQFRTMGVSTNTNPFFISEAGTGSLFNPYNELRKTIKAGGDLNSFGVQKWVNPLIKTLDATYAKYSGMSELYDSAEGFIDESDKVNERQREILMSYLRANPKLNGYGLTSLSDAQGLGEGVMDNFRDYKAGNKDMLSEAWAPLRWCIMLNNDNSNIRRGSALNLQVDLANEDVLPAGNYTAQFAITNADGVEVYRSSDVSFTVQSGEAAPFAYRVWNQNVTMNFPEGTYTLNAVLNSDTYTPASATATFFVTDNSNVVDSDSKTVTVAGTLSTQASAALAANGVKVRSYDPDAVIDNEVILIGQMSTSGASFWKTLFKKVARGAYAAILDADALGGGYAYFPDTEKPYIYSTRTLGALYHNEWILLPDDVLTAGLQTGVMDPTYFGRSFAYPDRKIMIMPQPDEVHIVTVYDAGLPIAGYAAEGVGMGTYNHHNGSFTLCNVNLSTSADAPAIEKLLLNLVNYGHDCANAVTAIDEVAYEEELQSYGYETDYSGDVKLVNGDFETVKTSTDPAAGFTFIKGGATNGTAEVIKDPTGSRSGNVISLVTGSAWSGIYHTFRLWNTVKVKPNTDYTWTLYVQPREGSNHYLGVVAGDTVNEYMNTTLPITARVTAGAMTLNTNSNGEGVQAAMDGTADKNWIMFGTSPGWKQVEIKFNSGNNTVVSLAYSARASGRSVLFDDWCLKETNTLSVVSNSTFETDGEIIGYNFVAGGATNGTAKITSDSTGERSGNVIVLDTGNAWTGGYHTFRFWQSVAVKPNTDYVWEFYVQPSKGGEHFVGVVAGDNVDAGGNTTLPVKASVLYGSVTLNNNSNMEGAQRDKNGNADPNWITFGNSNGWKKVRIEFNSGYNTVLSLAYTARATGRTCAFDDWCLYEPAGDEQITNPGFENGLGGYIVNEKGKAQVVTDEVHSGSSALKVGAKTGTWNNAFVYQAVKVKKNTDYIWSFWYKCDASATGNRVSVGVRTGDGNRLLPSTITSSGGYLYPDIANQSQEFIRGCDIGNWHEGLTTASWQKYTIAFNSCDFDTVLLTLNLFYETRIGWTDDWTLERLTSISNPGFETGRPYSGYTVQNISATAESKIVHSGKQSLKLESGVGVSGAMFAQTVSVKPNTDYIWHFWYKAVAGTAPSYVGVRTEDGSSLLMSFIKTDGTVASNTETFKTVRSAATLANWHETLVDTEWKEYQVVFNSGDNTEVQLSLNQWTDGRVGYTDDWSIDSWTPCAGDMDNDGHVNADDLVYLRQFLLNGTSPYYVSGADANQDGVVDICDLIRAKKIIAA